MIQTKLQCVANSKKDRYLRTTVAALCLLVLFVLIRGSLMPIPSRAIDDGAQP